MSIIAVEIPSRWNVQNVMKSLLRPINGHFEVLHFDDGSKRKHAKRFGKYCYLRLSERLDPQQVIENISTVKAGKWGTCSAFIPDEIPDLPMLKQKKIPLRMRRMLRIPEELKPAEVIVLTHQEILTEMQSKYSGLFNLNQKTGHKLLEKIAETICDRLTRLMLNNPELQTNCFQLSKAYRKAHPHFGDFQCILSTLHQIEDADVNCKSRTQLNEAELMQPPSPYMINNIPLTQIKTSSDKYSDRICKKVAEHIQGLNAEPESELQTEEDAARKRIRGELNKIQPYLPIIIKQVISKHLVPEKMKLHKIRIYGEPFMPPRDVMQEFLARWRPIKLNRSDRMYNLIRFNVSPDRFTDLISMDGTLVGGAKLVIRFSETPRFRTPHHLVKQMKTDFGGSYDEKGDGTYGYEEEDERDERYEDAEMDEPLDDMLDKLDWD